MSEYEITQEDTAHGTLSSFLSDRIYEFNQAATGFTDGQLIAYAFRDSGIPKAISSPHSPATHGAGSVRSHNYGLTSHTVITASTRASWRRQNDLPASASPTRSSSPLTYTRHQTSTLASASKRLPQSTMTQSPISSTQCANYCDVPRTHRNHAWASVIAAPRTWPCTSHSATIPKRPCGRHLRPRDDIRDPSTQAQ
jgi:hypothetical protein